MIAALSHDFLFIKNKEDNKAQFLAMRRRQIINDNAQWKSQVKCDKCEHNFLSRSLWRHFYGEHKSCVIVTGMTESFDFSFGDFFLSLNF